MVTERFKPVHLTSAKIKDDRLLIWWMVFLIIARLWLVEAEDFLATYTPHDDYLFIKLAQHILSGAWLGPYDQVTLFHNIIDLRSDYHTASYDHITFFNDLFLCLQR